MSKAILVIDMPKNCSSCPCCYIPEYGNDMCQAMDDKEIGINEKEKPDWCPLHEAPERDLSFVRNNAYHYQRGWNACVDKILS